jgi:micrococcal nuclease
MGNMKLKTTLILLAFTTLALPTACNGKDNLSRTPLPTLTSSSSTIPSNASVQFTAEVTRVIDGDTFDVVLADGSEDRVRLLGVDTPETFISNKSNEYGDITDTICLDNWGLEATEFATTLIKNQNVTLILDSLSDKRGSYGRLLAYVQVDTLDLGAELISGGYARVYVKGNSVLEEEYMELQANAEAQNVGLWGCVRLTIPTREVQSPVSNLPYDPYGRDRDCGDFRSWDEAQAFFKATGGPSSDTHRLDGDNDGIACESLS